MQSAGQEGVPVLQWEIGHQIINRKLYPMGGFRMDALPLRT